MPHRTPRSNVAGRNLWNVGGARRLFSVVRGNTITPPQQVASIHRRQQINGRRAVDNNVFSDLETEKRRADEHAGDLVREEAQRRTREAASA